MRPELTTAGPSLAGDRIGMEEEAERALRAARESGHPDFITTPTRVERTGLVIPAVRAERGRHRWRLERDWSQDAAGCRLIIPAGWETDLASVPRPLRSFVNSFEFGVTGPLLHDFLYELGGRPPRGSCVPWRSFQRREAEHLFRELMRRELVPAWRRHPGYLVVRAAGWTHWEAARR